MMSYPVTLIFPKDAPICVEYAEWWRNELDGAIVAKFNTPFALACALLVAGAMTVEEIMEVIDGNSNIA